MFTIITFIILILSIIIHEIAHGYAADSLGDPTPRLANRLTLNPLPHIDLFGSIIVPGILALGHSPLFFGWAKPVPYNPYNLKNQRWGETFVALAGSLTNIILAIFFGMIVRYGAIIDLSPTMITLAYAISLTNLFLGLFNLIPFPPLDGFTALRSALPWGLSAKLIRGEERIRSLGPVSLILFVFVFWYILSEPFSLLVSWVFHALTGIPLI